MKLPRFLLLAAALLGMAGSAAAQTLHTAEYFIDTDPGLGLGTQVDLTPAALAVSYTAGIVKNHPCLDGNKRTGFMLGAGFLERNGFEFFASEVDATLRTLALAADEMTEVAYAEWLLRLNSKRAPGQVTELPRYTAHHPGPP